jgi:hypothetical protein
MTMKTAVIQLTVEIEYEGWASARAVISYKVTVSPEPDCKSSVVFVPGLFVQLATGAFGLHEATKARSHEKIQ